MKKNIHPKMNIVKVKMTNGEIIEIMSTASPKSDFLLLDIDPFTHHAWSKEITGKKKSRGQIAKFNRKFEDIYS